MKIFKTENAGWKKYLALVLFFALVVLHQVFDWSTAVLGIGMVAVVLVDLIVTFREKQQSRAELLKTKIFHLAVVIVTVFLLTRIFPV